MQGSKASRPVEKMPWDHCSTWAPQHGHGGLAMAAPPRSAGLWSTTRNPAVKHTQHHLVLSQAHLPSASKALGCSRYPVWP